MKRLLAGLILLYCGAGHAQAIATRDHATGSYLEGCGGCHGLRGRSVQLLVPQLHDQVGYLLCTQEGRDYAIRLPNVAFSRLSDGDLANVMNYVMFQIGGASAPANAKPYTAQEVGHLRRDPLTVTDLKARRRHVVEGILARCGNAAGLLDYQRAAEDRGQVPAPAAPNP
jgi:cytochrome c553